MSQFFELLEQDYRNRQMPLWHDPATVRALCGVVDSIVQGDITRGEFDEFAEKALGGGDFAKGCENFVDMCVTYFESKGACADQRD